MSAALEIGPHRSDAELDAYARIACEAFGVAPELLPLYFDQVGRENVRVARDGREVVGGLVVIPAGQFFGGRSIRMGGVALVATAAHRRGTGAATELLRAMLREQRTLGVPISALYPATVKLYRRSGYEIAGVAGEAKLTASGLDVRERELVARPMTDADDAAVRAIYSELAATQPGMIDRNSFHWYRVRNFRGQKTRGYVVVRGDAVEGYVFVRDVSTGSAWSSSLFAQDLAYRTPAAARAILTFLSDHRTTRPELLMRVAPADALLSMLGESVYTITQKLPWMLRIVDVAKALEARGYPHGVSATLRLDVHDDFVPEVGGTFVLDVAAGRARVTPAKATPAGDGLAVDVRGLAALYSGYLTPWQAAMAGMARGSGEALSTAAGLFAGPTPWMRDEF